MFRRNAGLSRRACSLVLGIVWLPGCVIACARSNVELPHTKSDSSIGDSAIDTNSHDTETSVDAIADAVVDATADTPLPPGAAAQVSAGYDDTCARTMGGRVRCWGRNYRGVIGDGTTLPG